MATCCPPSAWPALAPPEDYTPKGTESKLEDLPVSLHENVALVLHLVGVMLLRQPAKCQIVSTIEHLRGISSKG
jgi:hypothetical protein